MSGIFDQVINYAPPSLLLGTVTYKGTWSAATNTPTLPNPPSAITNGNYYVVSAGGTQFSLVFNIGDWIISNGSAWEKVDNTDAVSSVFGRTGAVVGVSTDYSAVGITATAVGASSPSTGAFTTLSATTPLAVASGGTGVASSTGTTNVVLSGSPTITTPVIAQINDANGNETLKLASIASAVNEVTIENAATGNAVHISATGGDASVGLHLAGKGASGYVNVQDSTDATKRIMFNAAGGTTNTRTMLSSTQTVDRTISLPDATDTLVGKATTDTLTNKTLTSPTITGGALNGTLGATTPSSVAATTGTFSSTLGVTGVATLGNGAILGTPASGTVTNLTGTASININGTVGATTPSTIAGTTGTFSGIVSSSSDYRLNAASYLRVAIGTGGGWLGGYNLTYSSGVKHDSTGTVAGINYEDSGTVKVYAAASQTAGTVATPISTFTSTGLNSTAIGATTPSTGAFSTLSATGQISGSSTGAVQVFSGTSTAAKYIDFQNGTNSLLLGRDNSTGATLGTGFAYESVIMAPSGNGITLGVNFAPIARITSAGAAITGTLSATGNVTSTTGVFQSVTGTGVRLSAPNNTSATIGVDGGNQLVVAGYAPVTISTGLAVTGVVTATGNVGLAAGTLLTLNGNNTSAAYALQAATLASPYDFRFMGSSDSGTNRNFSFGYYTGDSSANAWNAKVTINSYTGAVRFNGYGAGSLTTDGSGNITAVSDERIKSNIRPFSRGLSDIIGINPILHGYTTESGLDQSRDDYAGFSAQQVQPLIPEAIGVNADGMLSFSDRPIMAALVNAIKELSARLAALESK